jgi:hypothetical protein
MRVHTRLIGLTGALALAAGVAIGAQAKDPVVGMWMLDTAKSTYKPGPAPKSAMVTIDAAGKGFKVSVDAVGADGKPLKWGYTSEEGKDVPVTGNPAYDTVALTRESPTNATAVYKKDGKTVSTSKSSVSADGKTLTITSTGTNAAGVPFTNVGVYMKH